jgi:hypothetical protein
MTGSIRELAARWEAAEARLYPIVLTRPDAYARYLELVRLIADELARFGSVEALADAADRGDRIAARVVERSGMRTDDLDVGLAIEAAFALRYRLVVATVARSEALARIERARARGEKWLTVAESGDDTGPYRRLELRVTDGAAMQLSVTFDAETGAPRFGLEAFWADPRTGDRLEGIAPIASLVTFADRADWMSAATDLRIALDRADGQPEDG